MQIKGDAKLLRIFVVESDTYEHMPIYEKIVFAAKERGLSGATVFKGIMGYGGSSQIHTSKILRLSEDKPLIIEIVDQIELIEKFLPILDKIFEDAKCGSLITIEKIKIIKYLTD